MRTNSKPLSIALALLLCTTAFSHPATERYIPIGESPGVSDGKSYIGEIRSVQRTVSGFTMSVGDGKKTISFSEETKIYLDIGAGKSKEIGTEADCRVGRIVEVYVHEDGSVYWVKIKGY